MFELLWLVPAFPFAGALLLALFGPRLARRAVAGIGVASIAASMIVTFLVAGAFLSTPPPDGVYLQVLWTWIGVASFRPQIAFYLDALSVVMLLVVTFVSFLIHVYSVEFMRGDEGYSRFFAYMNLFVACMVTLVLADNLLLLYLGWEGVGLCSYLLIGFWYRDPENGRAGRKAFIVTRVGDTALAVGLFLLFRNLGTLHIQTLMQAAQAQWPSGSAYAVAAAALLLGGAVGKSAQLPLQTWLPDAMAGPTPTSALIHAATMVTAGVYLIARTHVLFQLAPPVQFAVAVIGAATLLIAGFSALTQRDIKRVLAYSTISQIGYMFLALGVGAWSAAIFHLMTHAFFKALLFLAAGVIIEALHHEHNIFRMGGLYRELPVAFWTFLIAGCSLAGLPLVTAGAYSKDLILWSAGTGPEGGIVLWGAGIMGVVLTALYIFRVIFLVFFGPVRTEVSKRPGLAMQVPCYVLALLSIVGGFVEWPFLTFLRGALPAPGMPAGIANGGITEHASAAVAGFAFLFGLTIAWFLYQRYPGLPARIYSARVGRALHGLWYSDWGMDWLYSKVFVQPVMWAASANRKDVIDSIYTGLAGVTVWSNRGLSRSESGKLRWYTAAIAGGSIVFLAIVIFL